MMSSGIIRLMARKRAGNGVAIGKRLKPILEERNIGMNELDRVIGQTSGWTTRLLGGTKPRPDMTLIFGIAQHLRINFQWLAFGLGDPALPAGTSGTVEEEMLRMSLDGVPKESVRPPPDPWQQAMDVLGERISSAAYKQARKKNKGRALSAYECQRELLSYTVDSAPRCSIGWKEVPHEVSWYRPRRRNARSAQRRPRRRVQSLRQVHGEALRRHTPHARGDGPPVHVDPRSAPRRRGDAGVL